MPRLGDKAALITGAGGNLGRETALLFAREGARVAVVDFAREAADETVRQVTAAGGEAFALEADVSQEGEVEAAVRVAVDRLGGLDILFSNAGIMPHQDHSVLDMDQALWDQMYRTNVLGTAFVCKYGIPHLINQGGGAVVTMSSFVAEMGCSNPQEGYTATKGAIIALTRSLAVQFGPKGIRVNALCPGPILTDHVQKFFPTEEAMKIRLDRIPMGRFGRPEDVAELALFLASDASSWLTGQAILLDGGISVNYF